MVAAVNQNFVTYAGNAISPIFTVRDSAGNPVDISTVSAITWTAQRGLGDPVVITKTKAAGQIAFVTTGADGKFRVNILAADTALLSGSYMHTASIVDGVGNPSTVATGRMQVGQAPAWTYDAQSIATVALYQVRRLIGDTNPSDAQLFDEEIVWEIAQNGGNVFAAGADCCRMLAAKYSRDVDISEGDLRKSYSLRQRAYAERAAELDERGKFTSGGVPYAGGISVADKASQEASSDRVAPQFNVGMMDSWLPIGPVGNETKTGSGSSGPVF